MPPVRAPRGPLLHLPPHHAGETSHVLRLEHGTVLAVLLCDGHTHPAALHRSHVAASSKDRSCSLAHLSRHTAAECQSPGAQDG